MAIFLVMMILLLLVLVLLQVAKTIKADFFAAETVTSQPGMCKYMCRIAFLIKFYAAEALLNAYAHAKLDLTRSNSQVQAAWGSVLQHFVALLSRWGLTCTETMHTIKLSSAFVGQLDAFIEYASLRSRFVWHAGIRRIPSMYLAREPHTGIILRAHHRNRADGEVLTALRDLKYGSSAAAAAEEDIVFDEKGNILTKLSGFEFGAYLAERTEGTIAALIELPPEVWLAELVLAGVSFFLIQIPEELMFAVFIALALCMPALLLVLHRHLVWVRKQLIMPVLSMRAERHAESTLHRFRRAEDSRSASPAQDFESVIGTKSLNSSSGSLKVPLIRPTAKPALVVATGARGAGSGSLPSRSVSRGALQTPHTTEAEYFSFDDKSMAMHKKRLLRMQIKQPTLRRLDSLTEDADEEAEAHGHSAVRQMHSRKLPIMAHVPPFLQSVHASVTGSKHLPQDFQGSTVPHHALARKLRRAQGLSDADMENNRNAQISLFWCSNFGPAIYLFLFRFAVFTTAVYCAAFGVAAGPAVVSAFTWWASALIFAAALLPVICVVYILRISLPHYVIVTSVEHLKAPREVERVIGLAKLRKALKALRFLLTLMHQAQEICDLIENQDRKFKQQTAKMLRQGAVAARQKRASAAGLQAAGGENPPRVVTRTRRGSQMWKKLQSSVQQDYAQHKATTPTFGDGGAEMGLSATANKFAMAVNALRLARRLLPEERGDASSDDEALPSRTDYTVAADGLFEVDLDEADSMIQAFAPPDGATSSSPRRRRKQALRGDSQHAHGEEVELIDAEEGLCAAWLEGCWHRCCHRGHHASEHNQSHSHSKGDIAASMVLAQQEQVARISRGIREAAARGVASSRAASPAAGAGAVAHLVLSVSPENDAMLSQNEGSESDDSAPGLQSSGAEQHMTLSRDGTTFTVPRRLAQLNIRRRQREDIYNAFDLIDTDSSGYLTVQELQQLLDSLGVRWGTEGGAGHAVRTMYSLMRFNLEDELKGGCAAGGASVKCSFEQTTAAWASGDVMDFPLFLSWALRLEAREVPLQQLAEVFIRELGRGRGHLTPAAFHKALTALGLQISLEDVRELFMEHNPDSRPDMLTLEGLKDMLQTHL